VAGESLPSNGAFSVADPRAPRELGRYQPYGVVPWAAPSRTVTGEAAPGAGPYSVADPRAPGWGGRGKYRVTSMDEAAGAVIAASTTGQSAFAVADPRLNCDVEDRRGRRLNHVYKVVRWDQGAGAVTGATGNARPNVADPRPAAWREGRPSFEGGGHYGVLPWEEPSGAVVGHARHDKGRFSVADARPPGPREKCAPLIVALDGTWHRPFTTLELAALQGFPVLPEDAEALVLEGRADSRWRERIGNSVPPPTAAAMASEMARTLLLASMGRTFELRSVPIWVRPLATALSVTPAEVST